MPNIVFDIESYKNVFLVGLKRLDDGKTLIMEESDRSTIDREHLRRILLQNTMIGFNSLGYDVPVLWAFIDGASVADCKEYSDRIILGRLRYWEVENAIGTQIPWDFKRNHIDLIEPQPNPIASLKILHARLHGKELRDLPYDPAQVLTHDEIDQLRVYLERSDLPATEKLWGALQEAMALRQDVGAMIGKDMRSKSDTQMGLAIIQARVEEILGGRLDRAKVDHRGERFAYVPPAYISFETPIFRDMLERIKAHRFLVTDDGKVQFPDFLGAEIQFDGLGYSMGIGGLHSTESNRAVYADDDHVLTDWDVASYYPRIILTLGLFPKAVGPTFLKVYDGIARDRLAAKKRAKVVKARIAEIKARLAEIEGGSNG